MVVSSISFLKEVIQTMSSKSSVRSLGSIKSLSIQFHDLYLSQYSSPSLSPFLSHPIYNPNISNIPLYILRPSESLPRRANLTKGRWTSNKDAADHHWKPC